MPYVFFGTVTLAYWALIERRLRGDEGSVPNALANIVLARAGSDNYPQNAALWFLPCLFVTEMLFLGFFLLLPHVQQASQTQALAHIAFAVVGVAGLYLLWLFDGWTKLEVNLNGASTNNPFWMLCAAMLGFASSLMLCVAIDCRLLQFLGRASLTIMCVHEPVKRVLIFVMAKILGMNTDALRANLVYAMLVTVVTVAICVAVHLIMDRFAPVLIGSSRHNLASQGKARA